MIDFASIRQSTSLSQIAAPYTKLRRSGGEWIGLCPFHRERTASFTIFDNDSRFHCFGCGASGDVIDFLSLADNLALHEAAERLTGGQRNSWPLRKPTDPKPDRSKEAQSIWNNALPAAGTLAETYLRARGISIPLPPAIRFQRLPYGGSEALPCLIAAIQSHCGEVIGIQRIWLAPDGSAKADLPKPKLSLGTVRGGAIRLGETEAAGVLMVCEGPEDGLSLMQMFAMPVWVSAGARVMPAMQIPPSVKSIIIAADNDAAGIEAAKAAQSSFTSRGITVRTIRPSPPFKDFNDELRGERA